MRKSGPGFMPYAAVLQLLLAFMAGLFLLGLPAPAQAQGTGGGTSVQLQTGSDGGNDADLANMFSVRTDYFKRYPHAKVSEDIRSGGRIPDTTKEIRGATYTMQSSNQIINIPAGPLIMQQTGPPKSPDPYFATRPQYRPLFSYMGGLPGAFLPAPQPGMIGMFVPNYSKIASGQGGGVQVSIPLQPTCYVQPLLQFNNQANLAQEGDQAVWQYELTTFGVGPISDTQFQMLDREANQRFLELFFDPERWLWASRAASIMQQQQMSTNLANTADFGTNTAIATITQPLLNIANDDAKQHFAVTGNPSKKTQGQAAYMVQQMYHNVFLNMGILLLLPGALMTQLKTMVQGGFMGKPDGDWETPFTGIIRSIVAIFLIPATQLIMSYMIDVGNTMAFEVQKWVDVSTISGYAHEQQFGPQRDMTLNCLVQHAKPPLSQSSTDSDTINGEDGAASSAGPGGGASAGGGTSGGGATAGAVKSRGAGHSRGSGQHFGKAYSGHENEAIEEETPQLSKQIQMLYNIFNVCATSGVVVLADFQLVMMCYLMLLGPIAAAFYAWPNVGGSGSPGVFNKIFDNWLQAVVILSLWRFWWMVVLACLTTYIQFSKQLGIFNDASEWEMMVYTSFQVLLLTVPFAPFDFSSAGQIGQIEQIASQKVDGGGGGGGGAGGGSGGGGASGGGSAGGGGGSVGGGGGGGGGGGSSGSMSVSGTSGGSAGGGSSGGGGGSGAGSESHSSSGSDGSGSGGGDSGRVSQPMSGGASSAPSSGGSASSGGALAANDVSNEDETPSPPPMSS